MTLVFYMPGLLYAWDEFLAVILQSGSVTGLLFCLERPKESYQETGNGMGHCAEMPLLGIIACLGQRRRRELVRLGVGEDVKERVSTPRQQPSQ